MKKGIICFNNDKLCYYVYIQPTTKQVQLYLNSTQHEEQQILLKSNNNCINIQSSNNFIKIEPFQQIQNTVNIIDKIKINQQIPIEMQIFTFPSNIKTKQIIVQCISENNFQNIEQAIKLQKQHFLSNNILFTNQQLVLQQVELLFENKIQNQSTDLLDNVYKQQIKNLQFNDSQLYKHDIGFHNEIKEYLINIFLNYDDLFYIQIMRLLFQQSLNQNITNTRIIYEDQKQCCCNDNHDLFHKLFTLIYFIDYNVNSYQQYFFITQGQQCVQLSFYNFLRKIAYKMLKYVDYNVFVSILKINNLFARDYQIEYQHYNLRQLQLYQNNINAIHQLFNNQTQQNTMLVQLIQTQKINVFQSIKQDKQQAKQFQLVYYTITNDTHLNNKINCLLIAKTFFPSFVQSIESYDELLVSIMQQNPAKIIIANIDQLFLEIVDYFKLNYLIIEEQTNQEAIFDDLVLKMFVMQSNNNIICQQNNQIEQENLIFNNQESIDYILGLKMQCIVHMVIKLQTMLRTILQKNIYSFAVKNISKQEQIDNDYILLQQQSYMDVRQMIYSKQYQLNYQSIINKVKYIQNYYKNFYLLDSYNFSNVEKQQINSSQFQQVIRGIKKIQQKGKIFLMYQKNSDDFNTLKNQYQPSQIDDSNDNQVNFPQQIEIQPNCEIEDIQTTQILVNSRDIDQNNMYSNFYNQEKEINIQLLQNNLSESNDTQLNDNTLLNYSTDKKHSQFNFNEMIKMEKQKLSPQIITNTSQLKSNHYDTHLQKISKEIIIPVNSKNQSPFRDQIRQFITNSIITDNTQISEEYNSQTNQTTYQYNDDISVLTQQQIINNDNQYTIDQLKNNKISILNSVKIEQPFNITYQYNQQTTGLIQNQQLQNNKQDKNLLYQHKENTKNDDIDIYDFNIIENEQKINKNYQIDISQNNKLDIVQERLLLSNFNYQNNIENNQIQNNQQQYKVQKITQQPNQFQINQKAITIQRKYIDRKFQKQLNYCVKCLNKLQNKYNVKFHHFVLEKLIFQIPFTKNSNTIKQQLTQQFFKCIVASIVIKEHYFFNYMQRKLTKYLESQQIDVSTNKYKNYLTNSKGVKYLFGEVDKILANKKAIVFSKNSKGFVDLVIFIQLFAKKQYNKNLTRLYQIILEQIMQADQISNLYFIEFVNKQHGYNRIKKLKYYINYFIKSVFKIQIVFKQHSNNKNNINTQVKKLQNLFRSNQNKLLVKDPQIKQFISNYYKFSGETSTLFIDYKLYKEFIHSVLCIQKYCKQQIQVKIEYNNQFKIHLQLLQLLNQDQMTYLRSFSQLYLIYKKNQYFYEQFLIQLNKCHKYTKYPIINIIDYLNSNPAIVANIFMSLQSLDSQQLNSNLLNNVFLFLSKMLKKNFGITLDYLSIMDTLLGSIIQQKEITNIQLKFIKQFSKNQNKLKFNVQQVTLLNDYYINLKSQINQNKYLQKSKTKQQQKQLLKIIQHNIKKTQ